MKLAAATAGALLVLTASAATRTPSPIPTIVVAPEGVVPSVPPAHLSAYSPLAVNGAIVNAGDVLGFVGNTGDAERTPYHLHFEIHPIDPTSYLREWRRLEYLRFDAGADWTPTVLAANAPKGARTCSASRSSVLCASRTSRSHPRPGR